jgi:FtsZ-binding cell division protein ZapB
MQEAFNQFGYPSREVLITCHPDHCDLYESIAIRHNMGPKCLNGNQPREVDPNEAEVLVNSGEFIKFSTAKHIQLIRENEKKAEEAVAKKDLLQLRVDELESKGVQTPEATTYRIKTLTAENEYLQYALTATKKELKRLSELTWFDRLFNYRVTQTV